MAAVNEWNLLWLSKRLSSLFWACKHSRNRCFHVRDMLLSRHLYVTHCEKNLKFKLLYFQNKARYRAENMQADTFLTYLLRGEAKNRKVSLLLNFSFFYDVTWKPKIVSQKLAKLVHQLIESPSISPTTPACWKAVSTSHWRHLALVITGIIQILESTWNVCPVHTKV